MTATTHFPAERERLPIRPGQRRLFGGSIADVVAVGIVHRDERRISRTEGRTRPVRLVLVRCPDFQGDGTLIRLEDDRAVSCLGPTLEELDAVDDAAELDELTWALAGDFIAAEDDGLL